MEQHPWTSIGLLLESYDLPISAYRSKLAQMDRKTAMSELKKKLSLHPRKPRVKNEQKFEEETWSVHDAASAATTACDAGLAWKSEGGPRLVSP